MCRSRLAAFLLTLLVSSAAAAAGLEANLALDKAWLGSDDDVVAKVTITNQSSRPIYVPRWQVPGANLDSNLFEVTRDGVAVRYLGRLAKRAPAGPGDFVVLAPGKSLRGQTELTRHYDMVDGGEYLVAFRMDLADGTQMDELRRPSDELFSDAVSLWRDAPVRAAADWEALNAPAVVASLGFTNCSSSQQSGVSSAVSGATNYSTGAKNYMNSKTYTTVGPRYTTWFGSSTSNNFNTVKSHFTAIESAFLNQAVVVDCACTQSYYAYVYPTQPYKIYVCNAFWSANNTGTDSRSGTLVHEMSHFNVVASTDDWAYGQTACKKLAKRASKAIDNADSHEYFAENTPTLN